MCLHVQRVPFWLTNLQDKMEEILKNRFEMNDFKVLSLLD